MFEEVYQNKVPTEGQAYVPFQINGYWFTADVRHVATVGLVGTIHPIPNTPAHVLGYSLIQGETFVTVDLAEVLLLTAEDEETVDTYRPPPRLVVLEANGMRIALPVDRTASLITVPMTQVSRVSETLGALGQKVLWGQFDGVEHQYNVLNIPALMEHGRV